MTMQKAPSQLNPFVIFDITVRPPPDTTALAHPEHTQSHIFTNPPAKKPIQLSHLIT